MTSLTLALMLAAGSAYAQEASSASVDDHLAQAELFARKQWYADADEELRAALAAPGGDERFEVYWLGSQVAWELLDVPRALMLAEGAVRTAPDDSRTESAQALVDSYKQGFGFLTIDATQPGMVSRLQVDPQTPIFDADLKRYVNQLSLRLRERTPLPIVVGLPVGSYEINGQAVTLAPAEEQTLRLPMRALGARGIAALQVTRLEIGAGVGLLTGARVGNLYPAPTAQLSLSQPIGPLLLGLIADGTLAGYSAPRGDSVHAQPTWDVGLRVGHELIIGGPLAFRPSLLYRFGFVPGLGYACRPDGDAWRCDAATSSAELSDAPVAVYATGVAHRPGIELALDYREAGRTTALGTGVRLVIDQAIGTVPDSATAVTSDDNSSTLTWTTTERSWTATGVQMLGSISIAF